MGARHVVAHAGDVPATKNWFVDEPRPYPRLAGILGRHGGRSRRRRAEPPPYARGDWPDPPAAPADRPRAPYAVLHVGASTRAQALAAPSAGRRSPPRSRARGLAVVWSAGAARKLSSRRATRGHRHASTAGRLDLAQLWHLLARRARSSSRPTRASPTSAARPSPPRSRCSGRARRRCAARGASGATRRGGPWARRPFPAATSAMLFRREVAWVRRCARGTDECAAPRCMQAIAVQAVLAAADEMLATGPS